MNFQCLLTCLQRPPVTKGWEGPGGFVNGFTVKLFTVKYQNQNQNVNKAFQHQNQSQV